MKKPKKPKNKPKHKPRHKEKYPALNVARQVIHRREALDMDYLDVLYAIKDPKERHEVLDFLNRVLEEEVITNFDHPGKKFATTKSKKRELYRRNNARNVDLISQERAKNALKSLTDLEAATANSKTSKHYKFTTDSKEGVNSEEDAMLERIELKRQGLLKEE